MKILVIGSGGREHAIAKKFAQSEKMETVYVAPGNPGMKDYATPVDLNDFDEIADFSIKENIDFVFVGPEQPLADGIVDYLESKNIKVVGPTKKASKIESSKYFAKEIMKENGIPTADFIVTSDLSEAKNYLSKANFPQVIKADGLAAGKGVYIVENNKEAAEALQEIMEEKKFGDAGNKIVIEEFLDGWEASIFAFCDGENFVSTLFSQDHKKVFEGGKGPNTGGMGAYAPVNSAEKYRDFVNNQVIKKTLSGMAKADRKFKGILFVGLMITKDGPKVLEFNCRFGDPETEVILPLMKTDLVDISEAIINENIEEIELKWEDKSAVTVVGASGGYPGKYSKGKKIELNNDELDGDIQIYFAGVKEKNNELQTNGGRVFMMTTTDKDIDSARRKVYENINKINFEGMFFRKDIGDNKK